MKRCIGVLLLSFVVGCLNIDDGDGVAVEGIGQELTAASSLVPNYNYLAAVQYARRWTIPGGFGRNLSYPDFETEDCTNFVSQAARAGGVNMVGTGPCGYQNSTTQWYVFKFQGCGGNPPGFGWSTSWSGVKDFWTYHRAHGAAGAEFSRSELSAVRSRAQLGDIIQAAKLGNWSHSMIVTAKSANEISLTYHSSRTGADVVDKTLADFASDPLYTKFRVLSFYHSIP